MQQFIVCDLETTGFDPEKDKIIEVAFVKVQAGKITDTYHSLVNPRCKIPLKIKRLTGIDDQQLASSPTLEQIKPEISRFTEHVPLVGHNIAFDHSFLAANLGFLPYSACWDTLELARIVLPDVQSHSLSSLADYLSLACKPAHRALDDAMATAQLFLKLVNKLSAMPAGVLLHLLALLKQGQSTLAQPLEYIIKKQLSSFPQGKITGKIPIKEPATEYPTSKIKNKTELLAGPGLQIDYLLGPESPLKDMMPQYRSRRGQIKMSQSVRDALLSQQILLVEAGTGTGKSIAYILPALLWALQHEERALIATNTINLQEQIWQKDIPLLQGLLNLPFRAALLKGRANYICLRRYFNLVSNASNLTPGEALLMARVHMWLQYTDTGDKTELNLFGPDNEYWLQLCSDSDTCLGNGCSWFSSHCFVARARRQAENAHLVIINHSLLFSDMVSNINILPQHGALIIDEAHNVVDTASQHLGKKVSRTEMIQWLSIAAKNLKRLKSLAPPQDGDRWLSRIKSAEDARQSLMDSLNNFFTYLSQHLAHSNRGAGRNRIRLPKESGMLESLAAEYHNLAYQMRHFIHCLKSLVELLEMWAAVNSAWEDRLQDININISSGTGYLSDLDFIIQSGDENYVSWVQIPDAANHNFILHATPIDISGLLYENLFNTPRSIILTSATITVNNKFDHFASQCGLEHIPAEAINMEIIESPFSYDEQCLLCIAQNLPAINETDSISYLESLVEALLTLTLAAGGRTLVLFSSHKLLRNVYYKIKPLFEDEDICLLGHNIDGGRTRLIDEFTRNKRSVLFGSFSFWEGVDIPGSALVNVVIIKLPFAPPDDPVLEARQEIISAQGKNGFYVLNLPQAIIKFKQGFGRLIRSEHDRGTVIILDNRIIRKNYGHLFLNSLPVKAHLRGDIKMITDRLTSWLK